MDLGDRIVAWRQARGWNQKQLAERCGLSRAAVSQWESGTKSSRKGVADATPSMHSIAAMCKAFGITVEKFFGTKPRKTKRAA